MCGCNNNSNIFSLNKGDRNKRKIKNNSVNLEVFSQNNTSNLTKEEKLKLLKEKLKKLST